MGNEFSMLHHGRAELIIFRVGVRVLHGQDISPSMRALFN